MISRPKGIQSRALHFLLLEMQPVSVFEVARKIWSFLEKYFLGTEKNKEKGKKGRNSPTEMCTERNAGVSHAGVRVKRNISSASHERKKERGGGTLGCLTQAVEEKKSRGWWQKDLNSCIMYLSDVFTFNLQVKFRQQPKPTDHHILTTKWK